MFSKTQVKSVRRAELRSSPSSSSSISNDDTDKQYRSALRDALEKKAQSPCVKLEDTIAENVATNLEAGATQRYPQSPAADHRGVAEKPRASPDVEANDTQSTDMTHAFRLFSSSKSKDTSRIRLPSPSTDPLSAAAQRPITRPASWHLSRAFTPSERAIALPASRILSFSRQPRPGLAQPWRVIHISSPPKTSTSKTSKGRTRPGKKTRIAARRRRDALAEAKRVEEETSKQQEEQKRAKKAKVNRAKQHKKRAKARAAKAVAGEPA